MKQPKDMTDTQLINWLGKTERSGNAALYRSGMSAKYEQLRGRWESLVVEIGTRGLTLPCGQPDIYGDDDGYTWGDITC